MGRLYDHYTNPILYADYSDPDVIRVGSDYWMVASSFSHVPGLPLLHSQDLVHWTLVRYLITELPSPKFDRPKHGHGIWAPSIRHHDGRYYVYFGMPDEGIYMMSSEDPLAEWTEPHLVEAGAGFIDPCPFWDQDGRAYLVHAFAKSRAGRKSLLRLCEMSPTGQRILPNRRIVFDGRMTQPTIEGPKVYKRNGYYYILAPAGGVKHGWQTALRARSIVGPYEEKIVLYQGSTEVNGPHQGGLVDDVDGNWWFIHFQDVGVAGRILHLQPVHWIDDWPVIGMDDGERIGQPVLRWTRPVGSGDRSSTYTRYAIEASDDFVSEQLGLQWQWPANPKENYYTLTEGVLHLHAQPARERLSEQANLLLQKLTSLSEQVSVTVDLSELALDGLVGLTAFANLYSAVEVRRDEAGYCIHLRTGAWEGGPDRRQPEGGLRLDLDPQEPLIWLQLQVEAPCQHRFQSQVQVHFAYCTSENGTWTTLGSAPLTAGQWIGAKHGLYSLGSSGTARILAYEVKEGLDP